MVSFHLSTQMNMNIWNIFLHTVAFNMIFISDILFVNQFEDVYYPFR